MLLFLGNILSYLYKKHVDQSHQLYLWDLLGASLGCVVGTFFINVIEFSSIPVFLVMVVTVFAVVISLKNNLGKWFRYTSIGLLCVAGYTFYLNQNTRFMEYRHDPHLSVMDYKMEDEVEELWFEWNIYSRLSLIRQEKKGEDTVRHRFSIDGGRGNAHLVPYNPQNPYYIDFKDLFSPPRLAFFLGAPDDVLILMAGAGIDVLQANSYGRGQTDVTGIELNPLIVRKAMSLPEFHLKEFFDQPHIHMLVREGRTFLEQDRKKYDSIIYSWAGASVTNFLGISGYTGRYLFTTEAFRSVLEHLKPNGTLGIVNGNKLRLIGVLKTVFDEVNGGHFADHVVLMEYMGKSQYSQVFGKNVMASLNEHILFYKNSPFTDAELVEVAKKAASFDLRIIYAPNYNDPNYVIYADAIRAENPQEHMRTLSHLNKVDFTVVTDNRPFLDNMFYTEYLFSPDFWMNIGKVSQRSATKEFSLNLYTIWFIIFIILLASFFIILPLVLTVKVGALREDLKYLYYFSVLGLGFILVEIAVMNQFILFLGNPIYSFSVILAGLLISSGIGSRFSTSYLAFFKSGVKTVAGIITVLLLIYYCTVPGLLGQSLGLPIAVKMFVAFLIIFPLGFFLGMMFPQGLIKLSHHSDRLVPWAWGLNGYMSTVGSAASIYLSIMIGFNWFILIAAFLYATIILIPFTKERAPSRINRGHMS